MYINTATTPRTSRMLRSRRSRGPGRAVSMASAQAHLLPDFGHGRLGDRSDPLGPGRQDVVHLSRFGHQLEETLAGLGIAGDDPLGEYLLHVDAARSRGALALPQRLVVVAERTLELAHVAHLGPAGIRPQDPLRVRHHRHDLLADELGWGEDVDRVADRLRHLADAIRPEHRRRLGEDGLGLREGLAVAGVEG